MSGEGRNTREVVVWILVAAAIIAGLAAAEPGVEQLWPLCISLSGAAIAGAILAAGRRGNSE